LWLRTICSLQLCKCFIEKKLPELEFYNFRMQRTELLISEVAAKTPPKHVPDCFDFKSDKVDMMTVVKAMVEHETSFRFKHLTEHTKKLTLVLEYLSSHVF
jgi:hypothetical protein